jgi:hypothetical protein
MLPVANTVSLPMFGGGAGGTIGLLGSGGGGFGVGIAQLAAFTPQTAPELAKLNAPSVPAGQPPNVVDAASNANKLKKRIMNT